MDKILDIAINSIRIDLPDKKKYLFKNIHLQINTNSIYAIVGENGKGKTTLLKSILNLVDQSIFKIDGEIQFYGINMMNCELNKLRTILRDECKYILQDSSDCFDPMRKIGYYFSGEKIDEKYFSELLDYFLLPKAENIINHYPHELSIGMAQRLAIIWGLLLKPKLLLLDEPNSALDISLSNLLSIKLKEVAEEQKMTVLFISQDIDFAVNTASRIGLLTDNELIEFEKRDFGKLKEAYLKNSIRINNNG